MMAKEMKPIKRGMAASTTIVPPDTILTPAEMLKKSYRLRTFVFSPIFDFLKWLAQRHLIKNSSLCTCNNKPMSLIRKNTLCDLYVWKCKSCKSHSTVRKGSFFEGSHLSLEQIVMIMYLWSMDVAQKVIIHEAGPFGNHTMLSWRAFCRDVCEKHMRAYPSEVGGLDKTVEIDQVQYFHRQYRKGLDLDGHWVLGGIERDSGKCFLVEVSNRTSETVEALIQRFILPGTRIISDDWEGHRNIERIGNGIYQHDVVQKDDNSDIHSETVGKMWTLINKKLQRLYDTSDVHFSMCVNEFIWHNKFKENLFVGFLVCVREQYQF